MWPVAAAGSTSSDATFPADFAVRWVCLVLRDAEHQQRLRRVLT
jgi:hypothetical protein